MMILLHRQEIFKLFLVNKLFIKFKYIYPDTILDSEKLKLWFKSKENSKTINKSEYKKEKVHNIKENEFDRLRSTPRHNNTQDTSDSDEEQMHSRFMGNSGMGGAGPECHVQ